jgi:hypothetical protein
VVKISAAIDPEIRLPSSFVNCCVRVVDVLERTELVMDYLGGSIVFGSNGKFEFPIDIDGLSWPLPTSVL